MKFNTNCIERFTDMGLQYRKKHVADLAYLRVTERGKYQDSILLRFDSVDSAHIFEVRLTKNILEKALEYLNEK